MLTCPDARGFTTGKIAADGWGRNTTSAPSSVPGRPGLSAMSSNHSTMDNLRTAMEARLSAEEKEQIAWKTANQVYKLGLKG